MFMICLLLLCGLTLCCFPIWISGFSFLPDPQLVWSLWGDCRGCQWITTSWSAPKDWGTYTLCSIWTAHTTTWQAWRVLRTVLCSTHWTWEPTALLRYKTATADHWKHWFWCHCCVWILWDLYRNWFGCLRRVKGFQLNSFYWIRPISFCFHLGNNVYVGKQKFPMENKQK